jgi:hypothetical protein
LYNPIVRVAQEDEGDSRFISTYNKIKNTVTLQKYSISTGKLEITVVTDFNQNTLTKIDSNGEILATEKFSD